MSAIPVDSCRSTNIIGERSSTDFGMDFGGGVKFGAFYADLRYHYIWGPEVRRTGRRRFPGLRQSQEIEKRTASSCR